MKKLKKLELNRETLRNLTTENLALARGGATQGTACTFSCTCGCSAAAGCGGTNNCTTGSAGCIEN
jgi:hypothetical protein